MRVVHLNQDKGIGPGRSKGAAVHVTAMRAAFRRAGCVLVALDEPLDPARPELARARALERLEAEHNGGGVDLVYERYALGARAGADFARGRGVPLVLELNAPLLWEEEVHRGRPASEAERDGEAEVFGAAHRLLCVSTQVADYAKAAGAEPERVLVRPNAFDPQLFHPRDTSALRKRLGIPRGALVVGFHGRLRPWHGFETVVAAAAQARGEGEPGGAPVHLLTIGVGEWREQAEAGGMGAHHTAVEWVAHEDVGDYVACFDVLALGYPADAPCYFSPLKLLEAMASGAVPVVPDLGDLKQVVTCGESGIVYPAGDVGALARALARLARDPSERNRLGQGALAATEGRTWDALAREVLAEPRHAGTGRAGAR